jgi:hypothetical protein
MAGTAHSREAPPPSDQAKAVEAFFTRAAVLIEKDGNTPASRFKAVGPHRPEPELCD